VVHHWLNMLSTIYINRKCHFETVGHEMAWDISCHQYNMYALNKHIRRTGVTIDDKLVDERSAR
jgi:hypothetical protein